MAQRRVGLLVEIRRTTNQYLLSPFSPVYNNTNNMPHNLVLVIQAPILEVFGAGCGVLGGFAVCTFFLTCSLDRL